MSRSIALSGFAASGKTTLGPFVADRLGLPFVDTDKRITELTGKSIADLWKTEGPAAFRERERALVHALLDDGVPRVLALGGGTVTLRDVRRRLLDRAFVVTLSASPEETLRRAGAAAGSRPLLEGPDPLARIVELTEQRREAYAESHLTLATDGLEPEILAETIAALAARGPLLVPLGTRSYTIDVVERAPAALTDAIARLAPSSVVVVTDANVKRARAAELRQALEPLTLPGVEVVLSPGEAAKNLNTVGTIWDAALGAAIDRDALVLAFGGGVVGDLAGFAAATLLRGVRVLQAPTTLLAMVDASVGGKTGFDHPTGKNLLGAIHQPAAVVADLGHLETLPARERTAGLAEVAKVALGLDAQLLDLLRAAPEPLRPIVERAILAKAAIVRDDEHEAGARALLNLGHTVGHAIEVQGGFKKHLHGEAVAMGLAEELAFTAGEGLTPPDIVAEYTDLAARLGLPPAPDAALRRAAARHLGADKKRRGSSLVLPVVTGRGTSRLERVKVAALERWLTR
jgi:shikimate kinase/3-dehydroquinate synthase